MRLLLIGSTIFCAVGYSTSESLIASHEDSGALVVRQSGNNPIGMLFAIENNGTVSDIIPIAQIVKDIGLDTVAGGSPGETAPPPLSREESAGQKAVADNQWIKKLPHVVTVTFGAALDRTLIIRVQVDKPEHVNEVEHKIPPKLGGFPVSVEAVGIADDGPE